MVIYITGAFIGTFGVHFYRKAKHRNLRKQNICPYCKKQNTPEATQCQYCMYPMDEKY
jgi:predicted amidophosphoribosyltransferase